MRRKVLMLMFTLMVGLALGAISYHVLNAQQTPPTKAKGLTGKTLVRHDIGPQIPELQGYYLQMRLITVEPGGHSALHSHKERPVVHYILQGAFSDCRPDGKCTEFQEGQAFAEGKDVVHWLENRGTKPLVWLGAGIRKKP